MPLIETNHRPHYPQPTRDQLRQSVCNCSDGRTSLIAVRIVLRHPLQTSLDQNMDNVGQSISLGCYESNHSPSVYMCIDRRLYVKSGSISRPRKTARNGY